MTSQDHVKAFKNSPVWPLARSVRELAAAAKGRSSIDRHTLARVIATMSYVTSYNRLDPNLVPVASASDVLARAHQLLSFMQSQLDGWNQEGAMAPQTVRILDGQADELITLLSNSGWPSIPKGGGANLIAEAAEAFRLTSDSSLRKLTEQIVEASHQLDELREAVSKLEAVAQKHRSEADAAVRDLEELRESSREDLADSMEQAREGELKLGEELRRHIGDLADKDLKTLKADARLGQELVKLVGDQAVGGGYNKFARNEIVAYRLWNLIGILAGVGVIVYLGYEFRALETVTVQAAIVRVALSIPGLGLAGYAFQQASRRHRQSLEARYRALDLLALEPFTREMAADQQEQLRVALGKRLFASSPEEAAARRKPEAPQAPTTADIQAAMDLIRSVKEVVG